MPRTGVSTTVEELVEQFGRWLPGPADPEDLRNLDLFLTVRRDVCAADPCHWRRGEVAELLLDVCPRKVASDPFLLHDGPRVLGQYFEFLAERGGLRGASLRTLQAELAEAAPRFAAAMCDESRFGMAKSPFGAGRRRHRPARPALRCRSRSTASRERYELAIAEDLRRTATVEVLADAGMPASMHAWRR